VPGNSEQLWTTVLLPEQFHISLPTEWFVLPPDKYEPNEVLVAGSRNGLQIAVKFARRTVGDPPLTPQSQVRAMTRASEIQPALDSVDPFKAWHRDHGDDDKTVANQKRTEKRKSRKRK
jgi:hypothetical protein